MTAFITTWETSGAGETITLPLLNVGVYNATVDWGDSGPTSSITAYDDSGRTHTYTDAGTYTVSITGSCPGWGFNNAGDNLKIRTVEQWGDEAGWLSFAAGFYGCTGLTAINALDGENLALTTDMASMFRSCTGLTTVPDFDTSSVTVMSNVFASCSNLVSVDVSSWDTSGVTNFSGMFNGCSSLVGLNPSSFDVSAGGSFQGMFNHCSELTALDLSGWVTSNASSMRDMFIDCSALTTLNVPAFDTSGVNTLSQMFRGCSSLTELDLSSFDTSNVTIMNAMFRGGTLLNTVDVSSFDTSKVTTMNAMFYQCPALSNLDLSAFDVTSLTDAGNMLTFSGYSTDSYELLLDSWSKQALNSGVSFNAGAAKYRNASARAILTDTFNWTVNDGGADGANLLDGFLWYGIDDNVYLGDGTGQVSLPAAGAVKIGAAYGDDLMQLTVDGVKSAEVAYDGTLLNGTLSLFLGAGAMLSGRNLQRWAGSYADLKDKIDELMA